MIKFGLLVTVIAVTAAEKVCPYLPSDNAPAIEFSLPIGALSHPLLDLPIRFEGLTPIVTRKPLAFGSTPKVTIQRYSSKPTITYDEENDTVVISSEACSATEPIKDSTSSAATAHFKWMAVAVSAVIGLADESFHPIALSSALFAALIPAANAAEDAEACSPGVQVVVEAASAYMGAVETCMTEINDPAVCPLPFPTFETCNDPTPSCEVAVVGAGAGGLYTALRMVDAGKIAASDVCIFEMTERVGGRLFSLRGLGPENDLSVDAGGYRTWPRFTPTLHALITEYLGIPMACYDDEVPCIRFNIVDDNGNKAGFASFVEEMMKRLVDRGACFYPYHELTSMFKIDDGGSTAETRADVNAKYELHFANGAKATAGMATILNLPQRPLMNVVRDSNFDAYGILDATKLDALHSVQTVIATKLYLYYPRGHVFWHELGLKVGDFEFAGDARNMLLGGRYHDGHVNCEDDSDPKTCHGFLLAVYVNDLSGNKAQYFRRFQRDRPEPVTIISNKDLEGSEFLKHAHNRLREYHLYENQNGNYTGFDAFQVFQRTNPPEFAVLSTWNVAVPWAGGAWHAWTDLANIERAMEVFVDDNIYVVNEAFSKLHGWAEGSIKLGDQILEKYFDIPRPWSFDVVDINQIVQQTNSRECEGFEGDDTSSGGGGGDSGGDSGGGSGATDDDPFCFTADALVHMADGSFKRIINVQKGDRVETDSGDGIVTQKLVHPIDKIVSVAIVDSEVGDLVGTPSHPVFVNDEWIELGDIIDGGGVRLEEQYVDAFYNLEVDGHEVLDASHSYVVNGVIASGLGDNAVLNSVFQRQKVWRAGAKKLTVKSVAGAIVA